MISRRTFVRGAVAGGFLSQAAIGRSEIARAEAALAFPVPRGACDCHVHVIGDARRFPLSPARPFTPEAAPVEALMAVEAALQMDRVVVVQPSLYGTDHACALDALRRLGTRSRGVAVIDENTTEATLDALTEAGFRGIRLTLGPRETAQPEAARRAFQSAVDRLLKRRWHIQLNLAPKVIDAIHRLVLESPLPVVFDHFGGVAASGGPRQPVFEVLIDLVRSGRAYAKLSAVADSLSVLAPDFPDAQPFAQALVAANPRRILWGSNWPHPGGRTPAPRVDDRRILNLLASWVPNANLRRSILVDNPARLYGFGSMAPES